MPRPASVGERLLTILRLRCPACGEGAVFRGTFTMNELCPTCGLRFLREPGYFLGAMYFSYGMAIPLIALLTLGAYLVFPRWRLHYLVLLAWVIFLPMAPLVYRYSRVMWIHLDRYMDPE
jgi:uncharacterized protein (DUF983 family)